jgi:hypothetical protein
MQLVDVLLQLRLLQEQPLRLHPPAAQAPRLLRPRREMSSSRTDL